MAFKKTSNSSTSAETIEALYRDYKNRQIRGPLDHQVDMWRMYQKQALKSQNVALQLPTGSGKTLIGLGIGEWRRRRYQERVVYLCPTRQLVKQVEAQSFVKYGIKVNAFGKKSEYTSTIKSEYTNAEAIAVTTYNGLFNTNSFFEDANQPDIIILDDTHASENYIAKYWSLLIDRSNQQEDHSVLFQDFVTAIRDVVSPEHFSRICATSHSPSDLQWVEKIPTPYLHSVIEELTSILDEHTRKTDDRNKQKSLYFPWSVLRDHFYACHVYLSVTAILIRPTIPPTLTHEPFAKAKQRIYMSATLGEGGELERLVGVEKIQRLNLEGWDQQGIGRRLFFFPERSLDEESSTKLAIDMIQKTPRSLVLVPDERTANSFRKKIPQNSEYKIFNASQIEESKEPFVSETKAVAVVANRYDGIDLVDDECRLLIVSGLQRATHLQERFLVTRMPASILFMDRLLTRIVQAFGRCTRADNDYAAVVILGEQLNNFLLDKNRRSFFHPEIRAEIEYGIDQSKDVAYEEFLENISIFLEHKQAWSDAEEGEKDIICRRDSLSQSKLPGVDKLSNAVVHEVKYQYALWNGDFERAVEESRAVVTELGGDEVQGYRAFWYYLTGSAAWLAANKGVPSMENVARDFYSRAASTTNSVRWLFGLSRLTLTEVEPNQVDESRLAAVIEGLESRLSSLGTVNDKKFEKEVREILENLSKTGENESTVFENGHERLGRLLGYTSGNSESHGAPDPWWIAGDDFCIVFEDHSPNNPQTTPLGVNKVRQVVSHSNWIKQKIASLHKNAEIICVMVTSCKTIDREAMPHVGDACYWNLEEFREWAVNAISVIRTLRRSFPGEANLAWRQDAMQAYRDAGIDPASLAKTLKNRKLGSLPTVG